MKASNDLEIIKDFTINILTRGTGWSRITYNFNSRINNFIQCTDVTILTAYSSLLMKQKT